MAWRPTPYLIEGELDNTEPKHVRGWVQFADMSERVQIDLVGDFHRDIRGAKLRFRGAGEKPRDRDFPCWHPVQVGKVGNITAGGEPHDYGEHPYIEWYSDTDGMVVMEPDANQVEVVGKPIPWQHTEPISREEQRANFLESTARAAAAFKAIFEGVEHPNPLTHWEFYTGEFCAEARPPDQRGPDSTVAESPDMPTSCLRERFRLKIVR